MNDMCVPAELVEALRETVRVWDASEVAIAARALVDAVERPSEPTSISDEAEAAWQEYAQSHLLGWTAGENARIKDGFLAGFRAALDRATKENNHE